MIKSGSPINMLFMYVGRYSRCGDTAGSTVYISICLSISMFQFRNTALTPSERDDLLLLRNEVAKLRELLSDVEKERDELKSELETCFEQLNKFEENMDQARKGEIDGGSDSLQCFTNLRFCRLLSY